MLINIDKMNSMTYYPNTKKHLVFLAFSKGQHPSELVSTFTSLGYKTLMNYFEVFKAETRRKDEIIQNFETEAIRQVREYGEQMKARKTFEPFIKEYYPAAHAYLKNQPISWFKDKNFKEVIKILSTSPWELKN